jgi:hypothetical protein
MSPALLRIKNVHRCIKSGKEITDELPAELSLKDMQALRTAATQFQQAANKLFMLVGFLDGKENG